MKVRTRQRVTRACGVLVALLLAAGGAGVIAQGGAPSRAEDRKSVV